MHFIVGNSSLSDQLYEYFQRFLGSRSVHQAVTPSEVEDVITQDAKDDLIIFDITEKSTLSEGISKKINAIHGQGIVIGTSPTTETEIQKNKRIIKSELSIKSIIAAILQAITQEDGLISGYPAPFVISLLMLGHSEHTLRYLKEGQVIGQLSIREGAIAGAHCLAPERSGEEGLAGLLSLKGVTLQLTSKQESIPGPTLTITLNELFGNALPWTTDKDLDTSLISHSLEPVPGSSGLSEEARLLTENAMSNIKDVLEKALQIEGAMGVALVDIQSGMSLGHAGNPGFNMEVAAAGNADVIRAKLKTMEKLGIKENIEDILISLDKQYHVIRISGAKLFMYLVLNRQNSNLALARHKMSELGAELHT